MSANIITSRVPVFVSSVMDELQAERTAARDVISRNPSLEPIMFEDFGSRPEGARDAYLAQVQRARIIVCVLGDMYSEAVEAEVVESLIQRKDLLVFVKKGDRSREIERLLQRVRESEAVVYAPYDNVDDLSSKLERSLGNLLAERFAVRDAVASLNVNKLLSHCKKQVNDAMSELRGGLDDKGKKKYLADLYSPRRSVELSFARFMASAPSTMVTVGPAGIGKTNLLCHVAQASLDSNVPTIFLSGAYARGSLEQEVVAALYPIIPRDASFLEIQERITELLQSSGQRFLICIDAINETIDPKDFKIDLANFAAKLRGATKLLVSCRDIDWNFFSSANERFLQYLYEPNPGERACALGSFTDQELKVAWTAYRKAFRLRGNPSARVLDLCRQPLLLRFLAEGFEGQPVPSDIKRRQIFDRYWIRKLDQTGIPDLARDRLFKIVDRMIARSVAELPLSEVVGVVGESALDVTSPLGKILSEGLIVYTRLDALYDYVVGFAYEAFFEYVVALYYLQSVWAGLKEHELLPAFELLVKQALGSRSIRGALEFLILFAEERKTDLYVQFVLALDGRRADLEVVGCNAITKLETLNGAALDCLKLFAASEYVETALFAREAFIEVHYRLAKTREVLEDWASDQVEEVRALVGATLSRLETWPSKNRLSVAKRLILEPSGWVRMHVLNSLAEMIDGRPSEMLTTLQRWSDDRNKRLDEAVLRAVALSGNMALPRGYLDIVLKIRKRWRPRLDSYAAGALGVVGKRAPDVAFAVLEEIIARQSYSETFEAVGAIGRLGDALPSKASHLLEAARKTIGSLERYDRRTDALQRRIVEAASTIRIALARAGQTPQGETQKALAKLAGDDREY